MLLYSRTEGWMGKGCDQYLSHKPVVSADSRVAEKSFKLYRGDTEVKHAPFQPICKNALCIKSEDETMHCIKCTVWTCVLFSTMFWCH